MPTPPEWVATVTSTVLLYFTRSEVTVGQFEACVQAEACTRSGYFTGPHTSSTKCSQR